MPAPFWGHLDPEREELRNALLRAQTRQMQTQTSLAEMLGAQQQQQMQQQGAEDDEFQWEELEFKKEQLKQETELNKAQQLLLGRQMTLKEEEAQAPFTMGLNEMLLSAEGEPQVVPGVQVGGAYLDPLSGIPRHQEPIKMGSATLLSSEGDVIYSEPETTVSGTQMIVTNRGTGEVINTIDIEQIPKGFEPQVDAKGNVYVTNLDTGESELAQESAYFELEYEQEDRRIKVQRYGYEVQSKGYDVQLHGMNLKGHIALKGYDRDIDVELIKKDIQDSVNLTAIQKQLLINEADKLAVEAKDRRTEAMLVGYDAEKYGDDIALFIAELGYDETVHGKEIERDIQNSKNLTDIQKQNLIYDLGILTNESAEKRNTATIEASDRKLTTDRYLKGYVPQTAEETLAYIEHKAQIEAKYAPYTQPNDMNREDAKEWLEDVALINLFEEKGKTDEKIRLENIKANLGRSPEDRLKHTTASMMTTAEASELGKALFQLPFTEAELKRQEVDIRGAELQFRQEEAELKREGAKLGVAKDEHDLLMDMMLRATATHKPTYGVYGQKEKVMAANTLLDLIRLDQTLRPETKMKYLEAVPSLAGVTLAEELQKGKVPYFGWFRKMFNQALNETEAETGLARPSERFKGTSLEEIIRGVEEVWGRTGSRKEIAKYLKEYNLTLDKYREASQEWLAR